jgi:hypothetical protein
MDEIRPVIDQNSGVLPLAERMQVFCRADAPAFQVETISEALAAAVSMS